jgi:DNA-binding NarL/FixJ family response regulator
MINVFILDDHQTFREGLTLMLDEIPGIRVTGV